MRPKLDKNTDADEFINYYWLKEELSYFCKKVKLPKNGSKYDLTQRIYEYLKTGKIITATKKNRIKKHTVNTQLSLNSKIPDGYKNDERHRAFFKTEIGEHFKFNVPFMNWMKANSGKTYKEACSEWNRIISEKKKGKKIKEKYILNSNIINIQGIFSMQIQKQKERMRLNAGNIRSHYLAITNMKKKT